MKVKRDQITGIVLVILGIAVAVMVSGYKVPFTAAYPGPKALPMIAVIGFVVCGTGIFIESTISKKEQQVFLVKAGWLRLLVSLGVLAGYIFGMKYLGYLIMTPIVLFILTTFYAKGSKSSLVARIIYTAAVTGIIYVIYVYAFGLGLPTGLLFG